MKHALLFVALVGLLITPALARLPRGASSSSTTISLLAIEDGCVACGTTGTYTLGADGEFTGSAPSTFTATLSGCGGGTPTVTGLVTPSYGTGTYQIQLTMPTATGTNCHVTVTDNLGRAATSPAFTVISATLGSTVTANVHNAPGWIASHAYTPASSPKTRVLNGAGWSGGAFHPGSALNAYQLTSGSCTSASSGGPSGTGGSISDGSCTWAYLSSVDYLTISGWEIDAPIWVSGKTYTYFQTMTLNDAGTLRSYQLDTTDGCVGPTCFAFCTSTVAPTGAGSGSGGYWGMAGQITSDGCRWDYLGDVTYSSQVASIPVQTYVNNFFGATSHMNRPYTAVLWNDAEYVAGASAFSGNPAERNPIGLANHFQNGTALESNTQGPMATITITVASGEGFASSLTTSTPLAGYDPTKGVAIRNPNSSAGFSGAGGFFGFTGIYAWDDSVVLNGLQVQAAFGPGVYSNNYETFTNNIFDGGSTFGGGLCMDVWMDAVDVLVNNLVLNHGCIGVGLKYGNAFALYNTVVNVGSVSSPVAFVYHNQFAFQEQAFANNAISGFAHVVGENQVDGITPINSASAGNVTDTTGPDNTGTTWWIDQSLISVVLAMPGTTFGVSAASMFVSPGTDYRPNTGLTSAGAMFGPFYVNCEPSQVPGSCTPVYVTYDTPDILGNVRPNGSSQYSTGAEQHP